MARSEQLGGTAGQWRTVMVAALAIGLAVPAPGLAQTVPPAAPPAQAAVYGYADVADYAVQAATIIDADIRRVSVVDAARAPGLAPGMARFYVEGNVRALIYGRDAIARRIAWLVDRPVGADGRPARPRRERVLIFARPVANAAQVQLVAPGAQISWDMAADAHARSIATELAAGAPPPAIAGVGQAFHVAGTIAGEGETQIFLRTTSGAPVSLSILRRPGQARRWAVAFGEIVDDSAGAPVRGTIGHYRLACGLPPSVQPAAMADADAAGQRIIADDYAFVRTSVGACPRGTGAVTTPR